MYWDNGFQIKVVVIQGLFEVFGPITFFLGILLGIHWVSVVGGILMVIYMLLGILAGAVNPLGFLLLSLIAAALVKPWYMGVFWALAILGLLGLPGGLKKILVPRLFIDDMNRPF